LPEFSPAHIKQLIYNSISASRSTVYNIGSFLDWIPVSHQETKANYPFPGDSFLHDSALYIQQLLSSDYLPRKKLAYSGIPL